MKMLGAVSATATVLAGAALFASVVKADLDPIVIKVKMRPYHIYSMTYERLIPYY